MRKTYEDFLDWLGLKIGDLVKLDGVVYEVVENDNRIPYLEYEDEDGEVVLKRSIDDIISKTYDILTRKELEE